jgi:hypothetical protein
VLALPQSEGRYILDTDASAEQIGPHAVERNPVTTDSTENSEATPQQEEPDYVIEKIVGTKRQNDGSHLYRIRWY